MFSEADLWVTADPCTLSDDDPMSTLEFIVPLFIMWTLSESLESHLFNTVLFFFRTTWIWGKRKRTMRRYVPVVAVCFWGVFFVNGVSVFLFADE